MGRVHRIWCTCIVVALSCLGCINPSVLKAPALATPVMVGPVPGLDQAPVPPVGQRSGEVAEETSEFFLVAAKMEREDQRHIKVEVAAVIKFAEPANLFDYALARLLSGCPTCRIKVEQVPLGSWTWFFMPIFMEKNWAGVQAVAMTAPEGVAP